jgi:hypothetical protein
VSHGDAACLQVSDDVDLCLECFSVGTEINDVNKTDGVNAHRNDDPYRVMERLGEAPRGRAQGLGSVRLPIPAAGGGQPRSRNPAGGRANIF